MKLDQDDLESATGHLIRDNVNYMEDGLQATRDSITMALAPGAPANLRSSLPLLRQKADKIENYLATERMYLQEIYRIYSPR